MRKKTKQKNYYYTISLGLNSNYYLPETTYEKLHNSCHGHGYGFAQEDFSWNYTSHSSALKKFRELMRIRTKYVTSLSLTRDAK